MNTYKVVFAAVIFSFVSSLQANTNHNDLEDKFPNKKAKEVSTCCVLSVDDIKFAELEQEVDLGFNPYEYLPFDFNPYMGIRLAIDDINYIEEEVEINLGFDAAQYLPEGFDAHVCSTSCNIE